MGHGMRTRKGWVFAVVTSVVVLLTACGEPEPPPPPTPVAAPLPGISPAAVPPRLPKAPTGAPVGSLDPMDAPDPTVLSVDPSYCEPGATSCYYAYTTQVYLIIAPVWRSSDLVHWALVDDDVSASAMPVLAPWIQWGRNWAPSVFERPDNPPDTRFVMWYTAREAATGMQCLGVATASKPAGPFVDTSSRPAYCQRADAGTIDASVFVDVDDTPYLVYQSQVPAQLWISRLTPDGRSIVPGTESLLLSGGPPGAIFIEAPTMVRVDGQLYLFYSADEWWLGNQLASYHVEVARCDAPTGPCSRMYSTPVLASRGAMLGPGGQTPFQDTAGAWHMLFHAWTSPNVGYESGGARTLRLLPLSFTDGVQIG
jgi:beta-xylosidase